MTKSMNSKLVNNERIHLQGDIKNREILKQFTHLHDRWVYDINNRTHDVVVIGKRALYKLQYEMTNMEGSENVTYRRHSPKKPYAFPKFGSYVWMSCEWEREREVVIINTLLYDDNNNNNNIVIITIIKC